MFVATPSEDVGRGTVHSRQVYRCVLEVESDEEEHSKNIQLRQFQLSADTIVILDVTYYNVYR